MKVILNSVVRPFLPWLFLRLACSCGLAILLCSCRNVENGGTEDATTKHVLADMYDFGNKVKEAVGEFLKTANLSPKEAKLLDELLTSPVSVDLDGRRFH